MNKLFTLVLCCAACLSAHAQTPAPTTMPYGKIDKADLEMTSCDFEKDANAEVLFATGSVYFNQQYEIVLERHVRIKIFNDKAKDEANIRLRFRGGNRSEYISDLQAETINLNNGVVQITKVDKSRFLRNGSVSFITKWFFRFPRLKRVR